jgi:hypothetical protein
MGKVNRVRDHVSVEDIQALLRTVEGQKHRDKLMVILNAMIDPRRAKENQRLSLLLGSQRHAAQSSSADSSYFSIRVRSGLPCSG